MPKLLIILLLVYVPLAILFTMENSGKWKYVLIHFNHAIMTINKEIVIVVAKAKKDMERNPTFYRFCFIIKFFCLFLGFLSLLVMNVYPFYQQNSDQQPFGKSS